MSPGESGEAPARILIVDDEPAVREALRRSLAFEGYDTELAADGVEALEQAEAYRPDAIVLDVLMPRMDGLTTARRLRATGVTTPILMLTARDTVGDRVTGLDAGADDYLVKPFELDELLARLRALLRRSSYADRAAHGGADERRADLRRPADGHRDPRGHPRRAAGRADPYRVHPAGALPRPPAPGPHPRADPQVRLGLRLRAVVQLPGRLRHVPAPQDRGRRPCRASCTPCGGWATCSGPRRAAIREPTAAPLAADAPDGGRGGRGRRGGGTGVLAHHPRPAHQPARLLAEGGARRLANDGGDTRRDVRPQPQSTQVPGFVHHPAHRDRRAGVHRGGQVAHPGDQERHGGGRRPVARQRAQQQSQRRHEHAGLHRTAITSAPSGSPSPSRARSPRWTTACGPSPGYSSRWRASASSARRQPGCGSRGPGCGRWTG